MVQAFPSGSDTALAMQVQQRDERDLFQVGCDRNATTGKSEAHEVRQTTSYQD